ncbi:MAG: rhomboid family intramembrane serine protease [Chitinophagales bacterium]|nr:rhomboid family intramembrane serine protease [Chitinophagales bacterium]
MSDSDTDNKLFWQNLLIVFALVSVLWVVQLLQYSFGYDFSAFANHPRHVDGLKGIIFSPFLHNPNSLEHIISNTLPILVLLTVLLNAFPSMAFTVLVAIHLGSGLLVWLLAPEHTYHIGASGIVYGIAGFLVASGLFRNDRTAVAIALFVTMAYGGMVLGFIPTKGVSWQSHLYGALCGVVIAFVFRKKDLPPAVLSVHEPDKHFFEEWEEWKQKQETANP